MLSIRAEGLVRNQASWRPGTERTWYCHGCDPPISDLRPDPQQPLSSLVRHLIWIWLITWISTVPLFHLHIPDSTDRWSALLSASAHTVLSPDLPGEFTPPSDNRESSAQIGLRAINSPELGFTLIGEHAKSIDSLAVLDSLTPFRAPPLLAPFALALAHSRAPPRFISA